MNLTTILIIVIVISSIAIIGLALIQQGKADMGSAFGGGGSQSMFGSRGSANFLTKTTSIMCTVFFISCIGLAYLYSQRGVDSSVVEDQSVLDSTEMPALEEEAASSVNDQMPALEAEVEAGADSQMPALPVEESTEAVEAAVEEATEAAPSADDAPAVEEAVEDDSSN